MMEINDFQLTISKIALNLADQDGKLTVEGILDHLDQEQDYDKKTYSRMYAQIYNALRNLQYTIWETWHNYTASDKYRAEFKKVQYYNETDDVWQDDYFKKIYDLGSFSKEQIENSIIEAKVFEEFINDLRIRGIIFVIAGKGKKTYRVPDYHDFCVYKFNNLLSTTKILHHQTSDFASDGLLLPVGISVAELDDLSGRVMKALEFSRR